MSQTTHAIPRNRTVYRETAIHIIECASCNIDFGIGADFMRRRREDHASFYCPNGHSNYYNGPSAAEKRAQRAERQAELARESEQFYRDQAKTAQNSLRTQKGVNTKLKKRIAAGVCPCCQRTFQNVARHIAGQHPDYMADSTTP